MDSYALSLVILVFLVSLALYFVTTACVVPPPPPLPEKRVENVLDIKIPPVLRQNVAVGRLLLRQGDVS